MKENKISTEQENIIIEAGKKLKQEISRYHHPAVAFSAGIDSTLVLAAAVQVHGKAVAAIMITNEAVPAKEIEEARSIADFLKCSLIIEKIDVLSFREVAYNNKDRCYYCKNAMLRKIQDTAKEEGCSVVLDGSNLDDQSLYRPGAKACKEMGIISPLQDCNINKTNVRNIAKHWHIPNWEKPSSPCLLTRFPYEMRSPITKEMLSMIEKGEDYLRNICQENFRLRWEGRGSVRIEAAEREMSQICNHRQEICNAMEKLGIHKVTLDLIPFKSGRFDRQRLP